jgi:hypothetical protein
MQALFFKLIIKTQVPKTMEKLGDETFTTKLWHQIAEKYGTLITFYMFAYKYITCVQNIYNKILVLAIGLF